MIVYVLQGNQEYMENPIYGIFDNLDTALLEYYKRYTIRNGFVSFSNSGIIEQYTLNNYNKDTDLYLNQIIDDYYSTIFYVKIKEQTWKQVINELPGHELYNKLRKVSNENIQWKKDHDMNKDENKKVLENRLVFKD